MPSPIDAIPHHIKGTNPIDHHIDIPMEGSWVSAWPWFFAWFSKNRFLIRLGMRYDYNDHYYNFDISFKHVKRST
jgi:hypothetical protein